VVSDVSTKLTLIVIMSLLASICHAQIYKWVDANGIQHFSNRPPPDGASAQTVKLPKFKKKHKSLPTEKKKVIIYSTVWCGVCKKAKLYFQQNNIAFKEYDIEKSFQAKLRFKKLGGKGVPLILIGDQKMIGFSKERFKKMYGS